MRKLLLLAIVALLPGCALYNAYMLTGFDPNEYLIISYIIPGMPPIGVGWVFLQLRLE